jgi:hypothetical protein
MATLSSLGDEEAGEAFVRRSKRQRLLCLARQCMRVLWRRTLLRSGADKPAVEGWLSWEGFEKGTYRCLLRCDPVIYTVSKLQAKAPHGLQKRHSAVLCQHAVIDFFLGRNPGLQGHQERSASAPASCAPSWASAARAGRAAQLLGKLGSSETNLPPEANVVRLKAKAQTEMDTRPALAQV